MTNWKITYLDCNGELRTMYHYGDMQSIAYLMPPLSAGNSAIIRIEKTA